MQVSRRLFILVLATSPSLRYPRNLARFCAGACEARASFDERQFEMSGVFHK
jgi:hypothetical protein